MQRPMNAPAIAVRRHGRQQHYEHLDSVIHSACEPKWIARLANETHSDTARIGAEPWPSKCFQPMGCRAGIAPGAVAANARHTPYAQPRGARRGDTQTSAGRGSVGRDGCTNVDERCGAPRGRQPLHALSLVQEGDVSPETSLRRLVAIRCREVVCREGHTGFVIAPTCISWPTRSAVRPALAGRARLNKFTATAPRSLPCHVTRITCPLRSVHYAA